jgi:hypothetical protein
MLAGLKFPSETALRFLQFALGWCSHKEMSRVFTIKKRTYQVCCECGQEFEYSLTRMSVLPPKTVTRPHAPPAQALPGAELPALDLSAASARALNLSV